MIELWCDWNMFHGGSLLTSYRWDGDKIVHLALDEVWVGQEVWLRDSEGTPDALAVITSVKISDFIEGVVMVRALPKE